MSSLSAAVLNPLVGNNQVVPFAADLLYRKNMSFRGHFLLNALKELRAFTSVIKPPAPTHGLYQAQHSFRGEVRAGQQWFI